MSGTKLLTTLLTTTHALRWLMRRVMQIWGMKASYAVQAAAGATQETDKRRKETGSAEKTLTGKDGQSTRSWMRLEARIKSSQSKKKRVIDCMGTCSLGMRRWWDDGWQDEQMES